jgi:hypothetical protein
MSFNTRHLQKIIRNFNLGQCLGQFNQIIPIMKEFNVRMILEAHNQKAMTKSIGEFSIALFLAVKGHFGRSTT